MLQDVMNSNFLLVNKLNMVLCTCTWMLNLLVIAVDAATLPGTPTPTLQPEAGSASAPQSLIESSDQPTYAPVVRPTPQSTGRLGTNDYLAGFIICLTMNIAIIAIAFFFLCYLGKLSSRSGDEVDSAEPRQAIPWKEALRPVADKVFRKR